MTDLKERDEFLNWEHGSRDIIDFKKLYVDMTGDHLAALALSEIVYWHLPNQQGQSKLRVTHEGEQWIAVPRYEWWDRTRMTPRQIDSAMKKLVKTKLVVKKFFAFNRAKTTHVRINWDAFLLMWNSLINAPLENPYKPKSSLNDDSSHQTVTTGFSPNGDRVLTDPATPITESTTETTVSALAVETPTAEREPENLLIDPPQVVNRKGRQPTDAIPNSLMTPMKNAIASAFSWDWKRMTDAEIGLVQKVARQLCKAGRSPTDVAIIYQYCMDQKWSTAFTPGALSTHATPALTRMTSDGKTPISDPAPSVSDLLDAGDYLPLDANGRYVEAA